jgi:hypothetical protein
MKFAILLLCLIPVFAQADIFKAVDANGNVTYSSAPIKGGKRIVVTPPVRAARARSAESPQSFPRVSEETQKGRDESRRKILEDELKTEESLLVTAQQSLKAAGNQPKDDARTSALNKQVDLHQGNIDALKAELSKLK